MIGTSFGSRPESNPGPPGSPRRTELGTVCRVSEATSPIGRGRTPWAHCVPALAIPAFSARFRASAWFLARGYNASLVQGLRASFLIAWAGLCWGQGSEYQLNLDYGQQRSVDRVLAKVDAAEDSWEAERNSQQIDARLKAMAADLLEDPGRFEPLKGITAGFAELTLAEFKIVDAAVAASRGGAVAVQVEWELGGRSATGGLLSAMGLASMTWANPSGEWRLLEFSPSDVRRAVGGSRHGFTEVTEATFGTIDSFQRQLSHGTDHWRDSMDAALGVNVYGHQGISLGDYDGDGLDDLYVGQPGGLPNRLYRNDGDGTFSDVTRSAGLGVLDDTSMSLFADVDMDGRQDLILVGSTPMLFRNRGSRFEFDPESGLDVKAERAAMFTGAAMADYDADGDLDLYVCAYDFWQSGGDYDAPTPYYDATNGPPNLLFRNDGTGRFAEVSREAGLMPTNNRFSFAAAWGDYDNDSDADLYVANDFGRNNLYTNNGDGTFTDLAAEMGVEDLGAGMSAAWGDYDNDGDLDLYTANMWSSAGLRLTGTEQFASLTNDERTRGYFRRQAQGNSLFRNDGARGFTDVSEAAGVRKGRWAWASDFADLDGDGFLDLFVQNGYITGERLDDL